MEFHFYEEEAFRGFFRRLDWSFHKGYNGRVYFQ